MDLAKQEDGTMLVGVTCLDDKTKDGQEKPFLHRILLTASETETQHMLFHKRLKEEWIKTINKKIEEENGQ